MSVWKKSGKLLHYNYEQSLYPSYPSFLFYTWLYLNALLENPGLVRGLEEYDGFTDIEFAKTARDNCQAKACAIYIALKKNNLLNQVESFEDFKALMLEEDISVIEEKKEELPAPKKKEEPVKRKDFFHWPIYRPSNHWNWGNHQKGCKNVYDLFSCLRTKNT